MAISFSADGKAMLIVLEFPVFLPKEPITGGGLGGYWEVQTYLYVCISLQHASFLHHERVSLIFVLRKSTDNTTTRTTTTTTTTNKKSNNNTKHALGVCI